VTEGEPAVASTAPDTRPGPADPFVERLAAICGPDGVLTGLDDRRFFSQDVYAQGLLPLAVVRPATRAQVAAVAAAASAAGVAMFPRGGGMSYTNAFLPTRERSIVVDTTALDRIVEVNARDLYATVEAGCTWARLDEALAPHGLRATFWGPMSGRTATIGGAMSQGAATFGSGRAGASGSAALGFEVVLADGRTIDTSAAAQPGRPPFFRGYGPDLTGLFAHDAGALGIKTSVTLALEPRPVHVESIAFGFAGFDDMVAAIERMSAEGLASEIIAMDAELLKMNMGATTASAGLRSLWRVARAGPFPTGLRRAAGLALAGRRLAAGAAYSAHVVAEGLDRAQLAWALGRIRRAARGRGVELPASVGTVVRAQPFPELPVTSADGRRLLALHAIVPFSRAAALDRAVRARVAERRAELDAAGVAVMYVCSTLGRNGFLYEPFLYWRDSLEIYHERRTPAAMGRLPAAEPNPAARALVEALRLEIVDLMYEAGGVHLQIGKAYPYLRGRVPAQLGLLRGLKRLVDPAGLMNPGALGLD